VKRFLMEVLIFISGILSVFLFTKSKLFFMEFLSKTITEHIEHRLVTFKIEIYQDISEFM